jgi:hypothetical protein
MSDTQAQPGRTYAVVVGVERYAAGDKWNLNGPAHDARRFATWLHDRGVPADNISLFLAPLEQNQDTLAGEPAAQDATRALIEQALIDRAPQRQGDLLYLFWGGHGVITAEGTRRLFYADATATNMLNLDLNALMTTMRTDSFARLPRQICIVDTCANFVEGWRAATTLPGSTFPKGQPMPPQQFALLAARAGELAKNLNAEQTGLFTREVLAELTATPPDQWPPDMDTIARRVQERFRALRAQGAATQTPNYFAYADWAGNERTLGQPAPGAGGRTAPAAASGKRSLVLKEKNELVTALLATPTVQDPNQLSVALGQIRSEVRVRIPNSPVPKVYVFNIVDTCLRFAGAMEELIETVRVFEEGSDEMQTIDEVVHRLGLVS